MGAFAGAYYAEGPAKDLVWALKFKGLKEASVIMADIMAAAIGDVDLSGFVVVPVPVDRVRLKARGFNQSDLIARVLSRRLNLPYFRCLFKMERKPQMNLSRLERRSNLKDAFSAKGKVPSDIILVDDVLTTGATISECARTLREAGAKKIYLAVFARD